MSIDGSDGYSFPEELPIDPIASGSTVLVAGPALSPAEDIARSMVAYGTESGEGALFISTNTTCDRLISNCRQVYPAVETSRLGVIDCTGQDIGQSETDVAVKYVSTQSDLTGIGMRFSALYESLYPAVEGGRVRTSLISLSSLSMYVDLRTLFQFVQTLTGRIESAGGLGVFALDPTTHDTKTVNTLGQAADGMIELRETGEGYELRARGLPNQPDGWQSFSLS